jgi:hypothetical protein
MLMNGIALSRSLPTAAATFSPTTRVITLAIAPSILAASLAAVARAFVMMQASLRSETVSSFFSASSAALRLSRLSVPLASALFQAALASAFASL